MTERALALLLTLSLTLIFSSTPALSQSADDRAAAEVLFNAAVKNMEGKNFNGACPQLEESERLDPGVGTLLYLADCYENVGRTASAWATFREAAYLARSSGQSERERVANEYADRLRPQLSYLQLVVETPKTDGLEIARKSDRMKSPKAIRQVMWSTAIPLDAGTHMIIERSRATRVAGGRHHSEKGRHRRVYRARTGRHPRGRTAPQHREQTGGPARQEGQGHQGRTCRSGRRRWR